MRVIGMDIHGTFASVTAFEAGRLTRLGRVDMQRALFTTFAAQLRNDDEVVIEATGNAAAVAEVIGPHVIATRPACWSWRSSSAASAMPAGSRGFPATASTGSRICTRRA